MLPTKPLPRQRRSEGGLTAKSDVGNATQGPRGSRITEWYPSAVRSVFRRCGSGLRDAPPAQRPVGVSPSKAPRWGPGGGLRWVVPQVKAPLWGSALRWVSARPGPRRGGGGWHKASVLDCLPLAAPIGLSPLLILTPCGSERVFVVSPPGGGGGMCPVSMPLCRSVGRGSRTGPGLQGPTVGPGSALRWVFVPQGPAVGPSPCAPPGTATPPRAPLHLRPGARGGGAPHWTALIPPDAHAAALPASPGTPNPASAARVVADETDPAPATAFT